MSGTYYPFSYFNPPLSLEKCEKLPTPRLLAFYRKHYRLRHICHSDFGDILMEKNKKLNQDANDYLDIVKKLLDSRENV